MVVRPGTGAGAGERSAGRLRASPGRPVGARILQHGPTTVMLFELPAVGEALASNPQVFAAAAGSNRAGAAPLSSSYDGGERWTVKAWRATPRDRESLTVLDGPAQP
jgi:hypothetical protein